MPIANELNINTAASALDMANAIFGDGITVVSANFQGDALSSGTFSGATTTIPGIVPTDTGVILSTGNVTDFTNSSGTTDTNTIASTTTNTANGIDGDAQLNAVAGMPTYDGAILTADFIPDGDYLTMQFVFTSEEYPEYVNGGVNDAFGVWVNGNFVPVSITVAGNVSIDSVNGGSNENLYRDNTADQFNTEMDGITYVLSFKAPVNSGQTNTIKIGIADGGDSAYDSNLLIMGESVQTVTLAFDDQVNVLPSSSRTFDILGNDSTVNGSLTITQINGTDVVAGETVTLASGQQVRLNADNTVTVFSTATLGEENFSYTISNGTITDVGYVHINTVSAATLDGIVSGTSGNDVIQTGYLGDPDGDLIDNNDATGVGGTTGNADYIMAGAGNDSIVANLGNDIIYAGSGDDTAFGGSGDDWADLGTGNDSFGTYNADSEGNDTVYGGAGDDYIITGGENDLVYGGTGRDTLSGGIGNDRMYGGADADQFNITDDHQGDTIVGGETTTAGGVDNDLIAFGNFGNTSGVNVTYSANETGTYAYGVGATGTFSEIEAISSTNYNDTINAAAATNGVFLASNGGNDTVTGGAGADTIDGGNGDDSINAGAGADSVAGGAGHDTVHGMDGNDSIDGGDGNDSLFGWNNDDLIHGGNNDDMVDGDQGNDTLHGDAGADTLVGDEGLDSLYGGAGNDQLYGGLDADRLYGGDNDDMLFGAAGLDSFEGGAGADSLYGGDDDDTFLGGAGDVVVGGEGATTGTDNDRLILNYADVQSIAYDSGNPEAGTVTFHGGGTLRFTEIENVTFLGAVDGTTGNDVIDYGYVDVNGDQLDGSDGVNDTILGYAGNDTIFGRNGDDTVFGGTGDDSILGGGGSNLIYGDEGNDVIQGGGMVGNGNDTIYGGAGDDGVYGDDGDDLIDLGEGDDRSGTYATDSNGNDTIHGGAGNDEIIAGAGNDSVTGGTGNDIIDAAQDNDIVHGDAGNDMIYDSTGNDTLYGGDDADTFRVWTGLGADWGSNLMQGGEGGTDRDVVDLSLLTTDSVVTFSGNEAGTMVSGLGNASFSQIEEFRLGSGNDTVHAAFSAVSTTIHAGAGNDSVIGGGGADSIYGGDGADNIHGGAGDSVVGGEGGNDNDTLVLNHADVQSITYDSGNTEAGTVTYYGGATLRFTEIENIRFAGPVDGTSASDSMNIGYTDAQGDQIDGTDGADDTIFGYGGNDSIIAGAGNDSVYGGAGNDVIEAKEGNDLIYGDRGDADFSADLGAGDDDIDAGYGNDTVYGEDGNDHVFGRDGADLIFGGQGRDTLIGGIGIDTLYGGDGDDLLAGSQGSDSIYGGAGDDLVYIGAPFPGDITYTDQGTVFLEEGNDFLDAGFSTLKFVSYGGEGRDTMNSGLGDDTMYGGTGADLLNSGADNDRVYGDEGNDTLNGGAGADLLYGGEGDDAFNLENGFGNDTITGGESGETQGDRIDTTAISTGLNLVFTGTEMGTLSDGSSTASFSEIERFQLGAGSDAVEGLNSGAAIFFDLGHGNDRITAGAFADTIYGDVGNDTINGGGGADSLFGGSGDDTFLVSNNPGLGLGFGNDTIIGGETGETDGDHVNASAATEDLTLTFLANEFGTLSDGTSTAQVAEVERFTLGSGDDTVNAGITTDGVSVAAGAGNDSMLGGAGKDTLSGDAGNDQIWGAAGNDSLNGGSGNDTLTGGDGNDTMEGGDDRDTFFVGIGDAVDGGEGGDDYDVLDLTAWGTTATNVVYDTLNPENGIVQFLDGSGAVVGTMTFSNIEKVVACFTPGSLVLTDLGEVAVEHLQPGDRVLTRDNGYQEIRWVGRRNLSHAELIVEPRFNPVFIAKGALGGGLPERDMHVSPQHRMLMTGPRAELLFGEHEVLVAAKHLVGKAGIEQRISKGISYIHILFDQHEILRADGAWSESFQPGDQTLDAMAVPQREEILGLFPELAEGAGFDCARLSLKAKEARALIGV